ncbi:MAG TPA: rhodanese-like domain-containing protein [Leucothrix sp.]|nr:rhodanese-like domain-containing protein [Leucothrix sp.]
MMPFFKLLSLKLLFALLILVQTFFIQIAMANDDYPVGIKPDLPFVTVYHQGQKVILKRIQDTSHKLVDDFTRTSRPCPPFCIQPIFIEPEIYPFGELEIVNFLENQVKSGKGFLVDARLPSFYNAETIPGSVNIPWVLFTNDKKRKDVFKLLGVTKRADNTLDFTNALELCLFCSGPSCGQSPIAIKALYKAGYPASKLKYYRGGLQVWKLFGFMTILSKSNIVGEEAKK